VWFLNCFCLYRGRTTYNFNKITKHFKLFISLFLLLTILGCFTTHYQLYDGPPLPQNEVSILFVPSQKITFVPPLPAEVILYEIDGKKGSNFRPSSLQARQGIWVYNSRLAGSFRIKMLPGRHVLRVGFTQEIQSSVIYYSVSTQILEFEAKPGCVYTIELDIAKDRRTWKARVVEVQ
jgi:hypothetical protein